jgi:hypothetical protein
MPARDIYHATVKEALLKDGWNVTDNPFKLRMGSRDLFVDLAINKLIIANKDNQAVLVEIKSFTNLSPVADLEQALGQYIIYRNILEKQEISAKLYMAIRQDTYTNIFSEPLGVLVTERNNINLLIFDPYQEIIVLWKPYP